MVEVLIVMSILAVLAVIMLSVSGRMRLSAAKAVSVSQMRNIGLGMASWMADNAAVEPFYKSNGSGDYPHESAANGTFRPGNPARVLYNKDDPASGYVQSFEVFFSPLSRMAGPAHTLRTYDPTKATEKRLWGTYAYFYPHATAARMSARHQALGVEAVGASGPEADGKLVLSEFYRDDWCPPKYGKRVYHALLADLSVRHVADNDTAWSQWKNGK